jgi:hypothetical protein
MKKLSTILILAFALCINFNLSAQSCNSAIQPIIEVESNCDGTVTANFGYNNPNSCTIDIPFEALTVVCTRRRFGICVQWDNYVNWVGPWFRRDDIEGTVPTSFLPGTHTNLFSITFPADSEYSPFWSIQNKNILNLRIETGDANEAPASCPIIPEVTCMEPVPGNQTLFKAHFTVTNYNTNSVTIPAGPNNQFLNITGDQGQPTTFDGFGSEPQTFTLLWDGSATKWQITNDISGDSFEAPALSLLDLSFYNQLDAEDNFINRCENQPVNPKINCTYNNQDGTFTSWFGYDNQRTESAVIPVGTLVNGANSFVSLPGYTSINKDQGQGGVFSTGLNNATADVTWDPDLTGPEVRWHLAYGDSNPFSVATAYANYNICSPITPAVKCIEQTLDGNQNGYLTAHFGYGNDNSFKISIPAGSLNEITSISSPVSGSPLPGITTEFLAGGETESFTEKFSDEGSVTWTVTGLSATAEFGADNLCTPNEAPSCEILGNTEKGCSGDTTYVDLSANGSDPEGRSVSYNWIVDCGESSTFETFGETSQNLELALQDPGNGIAVGGEGNPCEITLVVSDDFTTSSCSVQVNATACDLDCAGDPVIEKRPECPNTANACAGEDCPQIPEECQNNVPAVVINDNQSTIGLDQCGVCYGDNTSCADCANEPNGNHILDNENTCCLPEEQDQCGVCFGDNSSCADCAGVPNGDSKTDGQENCCLATEIDRCNVCNGNGESCLGCTETDIATSQFKLDGSAKNLSGIVGKVGQRILRIDNSRSQRRYVRTQVALSNALYEDSWKQTWAVNSIQLTCTNAQFCVSVSNATGISKVISNSESVRTLVRKVVRRLRKLRNNSKAGQSYINSADANFNLVVESTKSIPEQTSKCS